MTVYFFFFPPRTRRLPPLILSHLCQTSSSIWSFIAEVARSCSTSLALSVSVSLARRAKSLVAVVLTTRNGRRRLLAAAPSPRQVACVPRFHRGAVVSPPLTCSATAAAPHPLAAVGWRDDIKCVCLPAGECVQIYKQRDRVSERG